LELPFRVERGLLLLAFVGEGKHVLLTNGYGVGFLRAALAKHSLLPLSFFLFFRFSPLGPCCSRGWVNARRNADTVHVRDFSKNVTVCHFAASLPVGLNKS